MIVVTICYEEDAVKKKTDVTRPAYSQVRIILWGSSSCSRTPCARSISGTHTDQNLFDYASLWVGWTSVRNAICNAHDYVLIKTDHRYQAIDRAAIRFGSPRNASHRSQTEAASCPYSSGRHEPQNKINGKIKGPAAVQSGP